MAKIITVEQALDLIVDGDDIVTGLGCSEAKDTLSQLHTIAPRITTPIQVTNCLPMSDF